MKRRIIGLLLALSCLFSVALAERPMRLLDVSPSSFLKKHPEIRAEDMVFDPFGDHLALMQSDNAPDLMAMYTMNDDLGAYKQANVLADLSQSEIIREAVSRMPQSAQAFVTDRDGRILALPLSHHIQPFYWLSDAWEAAGLTQADVPQSYMELLDFLESWLARIEQAPEKNICVTRMVRWNSGTEKLNYAYWLLSLLVHVQETQRCASATPMPFESPDFIQAAERARTIGLSLYAAEPREKA